MTRRITEDMLKETIREPYARALFLYYLADETLNLREIGEREGVHRETVRQRLAKGLRFLRHPSRRYLFVGVTGHARLLVDVFGRRIDNLEEWQDWVQKTAQFPKSRIAPTTEPPTDRP